MSVTFINIYSDVVADARTFLGAGRLSARPNEGETEMREVHEQDEIIDLGAASEVTLGIYDPEKTESLVTPDARDF